LINKARDLSAIRIGGHDEIFRAGKPVLVGAYVRSTYCYLLSREGHRDGDTWGVRPLGLADRGFHPQATIADFAKGPREGQQEAPPGVPCRGDVFHASRDFQALSGYLDNRAYDAMSCRVDLGRRLARFELRDDVLAVAGPDHATRQALYGRAVAELRVREGRCAAGRTGPPAAGATEGQTPAV
jgi:hypothetical protein